MLELTGVASVLRGFHALYWLLAIVLLATAIYRPTSVISKAIWTLIVIGVFGYFPTTTYVESAKRQKFAEEAWAYFKRKCASDAGERIYQTAKDVKSVRVIKALPPATENDVADQFWYGDPYSDSTPWPERADHAAAKLARPNGPISLSESGRGFDFVESEKNVGKNNAEGKVKESRFVKHFYEEGSRSDTIVPIASPVSKFGIEWEDISTPEDRRRWVASSRLRIVDLEKSTVVAQRIGYLIEAGFGSKAGARLPWAAARRSVGTSCPQIGGSHDDRIFIVKVLRSN